ncbi:histidine phosphatase family protein [Nocardioides sp. GY 10113]|uniref:SixA phosphatase family protein n=1 Tax=Nocardioides sp. GY 10113 TaxID=2569761 RepID=UPI0010A77949|nr:histidine phosphatase family protein [Nocardioides sp. GY 10113]TIC87783.1 histidine phosphatase family protein [Nocardioides sp. GY 10113]
MPAPVLILVRHAKAEAFAATDHERPLAERGHADAADAGRWLGEIGIDPDLAYVSTAARTRETWTDVADAAGWDGVVAHFDQSLYGADEVGALELLAATEPDVGAVVVVGHNPTMAVLAQLLDDGEGDASGDLSGGFPTSAVAVFDVPDGWAGIGAMSGRLRAFHVGRG